MADETRQHVLRLMRQKDEIEKAIKDLTDVLTQNGVGMMDPLVDAEGFPINSIDIYQVRHARNRIICLQNDHKAIMQQIESGLHGYYSSARSDNRNGIPSQNGTSNGVGFQSHGTPFIKVTAVTIGSPAETAGLQVHDQIVEFGSINSTNFKSLSDIAAVVQHSENSEVRIMLKRGERLVNIKLVPKRWLGRGLLGCNVDKI